MNTTLIKMMFFSNQCIRFIIGFITSMHVDWSVHISGRSTWQVDQRQRGTTDVHRRHPGELSLPYSQRFGFR